MGSPATTDELDSRDTSPRGYAALEADVPGNSDDAPDRLDRRGAARHSLIDKEITAGIGEMRMAATSLDSSWPIEGA
jgi:hypothetical protein